MRRLRKLGYAAFSLATLGCGGGGGGHGPGWTEAPFTQGPRIASLPMNPSKMLVGRFDADGTIDVAIVGGAADPSPGIHTGDPALAMLLGRGDGGLDLHAMVAPAAPHDFLGFDTAFAGHFNHDGDLDVVVLSEDGVGVQSLATVWYGSPDGTLDPAPVAPVGLGRRLVRAALADANGDYFDDLAVAADDGTVAFLVCDGNGGFASGGWFDVSGAPADPVRSLAAGDMNGDGFTDVVVAQESGWVRFRYGDGTGQLPHLILLSDFDTGGPSPQILLADLLGNAPGETDGNLDMVLFMGTTSPRLDFFQNNGSGSVALPAVQSVPVAPNLMLEFLPASRSPFRAPEVLFLGLDTVAGRISLDLIRQDTAGAFSAERVSPPADEMPFRLAVADLDQDGDDDLVLCGIRSETSDPPRAFFSVTTLYSSGR